MGQTVSFAADGRKTNGYLAGPAEGEASGRGVVVIQEWWGLDHHIKAVTDRFARAGFVALAPDLYHGQVTRSPDEAAKLLMALSIAEAERDLRGAVEHLRGITGRAVGTVGFCMGGALSLFAACTNPEGVGACVIYYGGHPRVEYDFDRLRAPVLGHWAEDDANVNANVPRFRVELSRRGRSFEFHQYPGTRHAFFNDERPGVYDREAAELSWERTIAFLKARL